MDTNSLLGTWRLTSYVATGPTGQRLTPYGERPTGYLVYSPEGRMQVIGIANDRRSAVGGSPSDEERLALYDTMFAYAGTFSVEGDRVIHHVDISWNETWTGTEQVRQFEVNGNILTITSRLPDPVSGLENRYALVWERVAGPD